MTFTSDLWICTAPIDRADKKVTPQLVAADAIVCPFAEETDLDSPEPRRGILSANVRGLANPARVALCQGYGDDVLFEAPSRLAITISQHRDAVGIIYLTHGTPDQPPGFDFQPADPAGSVITNPRTR